MENSKIGWTHHTMNFWKGCNKVSPACQNCYIGPLLRRSGVNPFGGAIRTAASTWRKAYTLNRKAAKAGQRFKVFTCSISDYFHAGADQWREEAWQVIRECKNLDWLIVTKRSKRMVGCLPADWGEGWPHVWLGATVENQKYTSRIDHLLQVPAALRFISAEPLLERINLRPKLSSLDWVITGCDQAARGKRREMDLAWVRDVRDQCDEAAVPLFHKQDYRGTRICTDGVIDGVVRQDFPK